MKLYRIGINNYWRTACVILDDVPVGLYFLENTVMWVCDKIPFIPLPKLKFRLKDKDAWDMTENGDGRTDLQYWFGDTQQLFHIYCCNPVTDFVNKHAKSTTINLPYNFLKAQFPDLFKEDDYDYDEEDIVHMQKTNQLADWLDVQFRELYGKLNYNYMDDSMKGK